MTIRCIAFDLDNTLWDVNPVIEKAEQHFYQWLQSSYPKVCEKYSAADLLANRMEYMRARPESHHNLTVLRKSWLAKLADEMRCNEDFIELGFDVFWQARNQVSFYDGALQALEQLCKKYSLGVISNGNADVHHIGIGHLFDFVLSSEEAGVAKPHKDIFHQAYELSKVEMHEIIYVGDDPTRDIVGAQSAGIKAIWYNPDTQPWPGGQTPAAIFKHHHELEDKIKNL